MDWKLIKVDHLDWLQDDSGFYTLINWTGKTVRIDVMTEVGDKPVVSFQGKADDVRKAVMRWFDNKLLLSSNRLSLEHAAYIGTELSRAGMLEDDYFQD